MRALVSDPSRDCMAYRSDFMNLLYERGHIHQCTNNAGLDAAFARGFTGYIGFDLTAPSLHAGSLMVIMLLRRLQQAGGRPIVLLGGGTTLIGDPSGKDEARRLLQLEQIAENKARLGSVFSRYLTFGSGATDAVIVDNAEWLLGLGYMELLETVGRHFTVNRMVAMDSVKQRLNREQPLSFLEFNYMILQAYDFIELFKGLGCTLQMGASDQWGNIIGGIELGGRLCQAQLYGLTTPLLLTSDGLKMGKSVKGAVWLNADMLSAEDYYAYWLGTGPADVERLLGLLTDLPMDEVRRLGALRDSEAVVARRALAFETTAILHGRKAASRAAELAVSLG